jgi:hypothetical protein
MATPAQVEKLYPKLDNDQLAALVFNALARGDDDERLTILGSVGQKHYQCLDQEFSLRLDGYTDLGMFYGMVYWKARCCMEVMGNNHKERGDGADQEAAFVFLDKLQAMDSALQEVCAKLNIDVLAMKKIAGCYDEYIPDKCGNGELVREYVGLFSGLLESI